MRFDAKISFRYLGQETSLLSIKVAETFSTHLI